jgi:hypothetical protein
MWDFLWTKWHWSRFSPSIAVSPAGLNSTSCSTITTIYNLGLVQKANSGRSSEWTQSHFTENNKNNKKLLTVTIRIFSQNCCWIAAEEET